jgi:hypothetical protein
LDRSTEEVTERWHSRNQKPCLAADGVDHAGGPNPQTVSSPISQVRAIGVIRAIRGFDRMFCTFCAFFAADP